MKTLVFSLLLLGLLAVSGLSPVCAEDRPPPLCKGKVLILKNEYTIEGDIERVGDRYCVRRKLGETWVPAERVLVLTASLPDAYIYLRGRINLDDPDERLQLARWCRDNGLPQQALAELQAAAALRPNHAETRRLLQYWQQDAASHVSKRSGSASGGSSPVANASGSFGKPVADPPPIEVTTESLGLFATRIQPILMNTCARCHATGHGGNFNLTQVFDNTINNRQTLERNLASVLAEIDVNQPEASRLLIKAVSDHAHTGLAPLHDRQAAPYRALESWVKLTVADNPHLRDKSEAAAHVPTRSVGARDSGMETRTSEATPIGEARAKAGEESQWGAEARPSASSPSSPGSSGNSGKAASGSPVTTADPYDPEPFNRTMHPEANK
ncbi:MAG TPA: hypothetical protein VMF69_24310 [Gemmataceae bacterium]|nr:hypothetical protein [Gemmataceae bacterium]